MAVSLGLERGVVRLAEYDARWPDLFIAEQQRIRGQCSELALRLEHVGGTSIPGMCAKPVLDIAAGRPPEASIQDCVALLERAAYEHRGERAACRAESSFAEASLARTTCTSSMRAALCGATTSPFATICGPMPRPRAGSPT